MTRKPNQIDRDKLRAAVRKLGNEYIFFMLDDAIELLPPAKLYKIAKKYLDLERLRPDATEAMKPSLLTDVNSLRRPVWLASTTNHPASIPKIIRNSPVGRARGLPSTVGSLIAVW